MSVLPFPCYQCETCGARVWQFPPMDKPPDLLSLAEEFGVQHAEGKCLHCIIDAIRVIGADRAK